MIELERKYRVSAVEAERLAASLNLPDRPDVQKDLVYLPEGVSFKNLPKGDPVVRIRQNSDGTTVTVKRRLPGSAALESELSLEMARSGDPQVFLRYLKWQLIVTVLKERRQGQLMGVTVAVDKVDQLGHFVELEMVTDKDGDLVKAEAVLDSVREHLRIDESSRETLKYDELLIRIGRRIK